ncbi:MAG TPA: PIG-L deacetylase family protein [Gemmatimonadaceae bacterium]|nr:PIG-L deacetylase family protein [Gemmatimonadaceae bacterium]
MTPHPELKVLVPSDEPLRVLFLGAHSDDIEIGCGGTVLELLHARPDAEVRWVVFSAPGVRAAEARRSAKRFIGNRAATAVELHEFRDGFFPSLLAPIKEAFEGIARSFSPSVVFTHHREDRHQDHRVVSDLAWNTFRRAAILEYEIPKWDGGLGMPNCYVALSPTVARRKVKFLMDGFASQRSKDWFDEETFRGMARLRGVECRSESGYAEAFFGRKLTFTW